MSFRRAAEKDLPAIHRLLQQVLTVHAEIRPDIFVPGTVKYTDGELAGMIRDDSAPIYVYTDDMDEVLGYAFCVLQEPVPSNNRIPRRTLYIDDLCVDSAVRGQGIGKAIFLQVCEEAKALHCDEITLNVWEGNDCARRFYEKLGMKVRKTVMEFSL